MDEFDDIDFSESDQSAVVEGSTNPLRNPRVAKSVTADYDSTEFDIVSPEDAERERLEQIKKERFANKDFGIAVRNIEQNILGREITVDEYDKMCRSYATVLYEEDVKLTKKGMSLDPSIRQKYYEDLINNRPIKRAHRGYYEQQEAFAADDIGKELERVKSQPIGELEIKSGKPINYNHKGQVKITGNENGLVYIINNEKDVKLLNMKNRQIWLDKRFSDEIASELGNGKASVHGADGFE